MRDHRWRGGRHLACMAPDARSFEEVLKTRLKEAGVHGLNRAGHDWRYRRAPCAASDACIRCEIPSLPQQVVAAAATTYPSARSHRIVPRTRRSDGGGTLGVRRGRSIPFARAQCSDIGSAGSNQLTHHDALILRRVFLGQELRFPSGVAPVNLTATLWFREVMSFRARCGSRSGWFCKPSCILAAGWMGRCCRSWLAFSSRHPGVHIHVHGRDGHQDGHTARSPGFSMHRRRWDGRERRRGSRSRNCPCSRRSVCRVRLSLTR